MNIVLVSAYIALILMVVYITNRAKIVGYFIRNQKFKCTNCTKCCKLLVKLTPKDIKHIKKAGYKEGHFVENKRKQKWLKRVNYYCTFLSIKSGKSKCDIYPDRPEICKGFPKKPTLFGVEGNDPRCSSFDSSKFP